MRDSHRHDDIELNLSDAEISYVIGSDTVVIPAGRLCAFWASRPHRLVDSGHDTQIAWTTVPLRQFVSWTLTPSSIQRLLAGEVLVADAATSRLYEALVPLWQHELLPFARHELGPANLELEALVRRLVNTPRYGKSKGERVTGLSSRCATMAAFISAHAVDSISAADVADQVHLHPRYAMTLFKQFFGVSIGTYIRQNRVAAAQSRLILTNDSVQQIAADVGFESTSSFYTAFAAVSGLSPSQYRADRRSGLGD